MEKLRLAVVGCGGISAAHVRGLKMLWEKGLVRFIAEAVCDIVKENALVRARELAAFQGAQPRVYTALEDVLKHEEGLEAVDICTDHRSHHEIAVRCLQSGMHVIVEKPLGITMRACRAMNDATEANRRVLATAENYRRMAANRAIRWAVESGKIGAPRLLLWQEVGYDLAPVVGTPWRHDKAKAGGGWVLDGGVHFADLFLYTLGEVDEVYAATKTFEPIRYNDWPNRLRQLPCTVEDASSALLLFKNGAVGQWSWTSVAPGERLDYRAIHGSGGSVSWTSGLKTLMPGGLGQNTYSVPELVRLMMRSLIPEERVRYFPEGIGVDLANFDASIAVELHDFARAIREDRRPEVDGRLGAKAEAIPMAIYESSWLREPVRVRDVEDCKVENYQREINEALGL